MPTFYDADGKAVPVTPEEAHEGYKTGVLLPRKGQKIGVVTPDGVKDVAAEDLNQALDSGLKIASDKEYRHAQLESKYGKPGTALGAAHAFAAAQAGVSRGATAGISDAAIVEGAKAFLGEKRGKKAAQTLSELKELHPVISTGNEVAGTIASAFIPVGGEAKAVAGGAKALEASRAVEGLAGGAKDVEAALSLARGTGEAKGLSTAAEGAATLSKLDARAGAEGLASAEHVADTTKALDALDATHGAAGGPRPVTVADLGSARPANVAPHPIEPPLPPPTITPSATAIHGTEDILATEAALHPTAPFTPPVPGASPFPKAFVPSGAIDLAGGAVEHAIGSVGKGLLGESLPARLATRGAAMAGRGATEGALFGAGQELSESELGNHELTAEKVVAAMTHGAFMGGLIGGAGGVAGELGGTALSSLAPNLRKAAGEQAWKQLSPLKKYTDEANKFAGGSHEVGNTLNRYSAHGSVEKLSELIPSIRQSVGAKLGQEFGASNAFIKPFDLYQMLERQIAKEGKTWGNEAIVHGLREYQLSLGIKSGLLEEVTLENGARMMRMRPGAAHIEMSVQDALAQRQLLDDVIYKEGGIMNPSARVEKLRDFRREFDSHMMGEIEKAAGDMGAETRARIMSLKRDYQHLSIADRAVKTSMSRMATNRGLSITDNMYGAASAGAALAAGHPLTAVGGLAVAYGHKMLRERGNSLAAPLLDKLADLAAIRTVAAKSEKEMDAAAKGFFGSLNRKPKMVSYGKKTQDDRYDDAVRTITHASVSQDRLISSLTDRTAGIATHAPLTQGAISATVAKGVNYLASQIPDQHVDDTSLTPTEERPVVSASQKAEFLRKVEAVHSPLTVIKAIPSGVVTRDQMLAIKEVYPALYGDVRDRLLLELQQQAHKGKKVSLQKKIQLGIILDAKTDRSLTPQFISLQQQMRHNGSKPSPHDSQPFGSSKQSRPVSGFSDMYVTSLDKREKGEHR